MWNGVPMSGSVEAERREREEAKKMGPEKLEEKRKRLGK